MNDNIKLIEATNNVLLEKIRKIKFKSNSFSRISNKWKNRKISSPIIKRFKFKLASANDVNSVQTEWKDVKSFGTRPLSVSNDMYTGFKKNSENVYFDTDMHDMLRKVGFEESSTHSGVDVEFNSDEIQTAVSDAFNVVDTEVDKNVSPEDVSSALKEDKENSHITTNEAGKAKIDKFSDFDHLYGFRREEIDPTFRITPIDEKSFGFVDIPADVNNDIFGIKPEINQDERETNQEIYNELFSGEDAINEGETSEYNMTESSHTSREVPIVVPERKSSELFKFEDSFTNISSNAPDQDIVPISSSSVVADLEKKIKNATSLTEVNNLLKEIKRLNDEAAEKKRMAEEARKQAEDAEHQLNAKEQETAKAFQELLARKEELAASIVEDEAELKENEAKLQESHARSAELDAMIKNMHDVMGGFGSNYEMYAGKGK